MSSIAAFDSEHTTIAFALFGDIFLSMLYYIEIILRIVAVLPVPGGPCTKNIPLYAEIML